MENNTSDRNEVSAKNDSTSHDANLEPVESESRPDKRIRRRDVLRGVTSAGIFASSLPVIGSAASEEEVEVTDVDDLSGSEKQKVIKKAKSDSEFELIENDLLNKGFVEESSSAFVSHSPNGDFYTVTIKYASGDQSAAINWSSLEDVETTGIIQSPLSTRPVTANSLERTSKNNGDIQPQIDVPDLPDLPGCPGTDWICFYQTIYLNGVPGINCSICVAGMVAGETGRCGACLDSILKMYRPCTICTGN